MDEQADRFNRLMAALEAATNAINRLAQDIEARERKGARRAAVKTRRVPTRKVVITERAEATAKAALARHSRLG